MKLYCLPGALVSFVSITILGGHCVAQTLTYEADLGPAVTRANNEGKLVLGDFGTPSCSECQQTAKIWNTPSVKRWLLAGTVPWQLDVYTSTACQPYAGDMGGAALPVVVWIDPGKSGSYVYRANGLMNATLFTRYMTNQLTKYLPLMVMNLPGDVVNNYAYTIQGIAKTNALLKGSIVNVGISSIMWRLESANGASGPFQPASTLSMVSTSQASWSQDLTLAPGTNIFASYVQYVNGQNSWTNRVPLVYDGPAAGIAPTLTTQPLGQAIQLGAPLTLMVAATGTAPLGYQWLRDGVPLAQHGASLSLASALLSDAGDYSVVVTNNYGSVTSAVATVTVARPPLLFSTSGGGLKISNGMLHFEITGLAQTGDVVLYASTNLVDWQPIFTNTPVLGTWQYQDALVTKGARFYRVGEPK